MYFAVLRSLVFWLLLVTHSRALIIFAKKGVLNNIYKSSSPSCVLVAWLWDLNSLPVFTFPEMRTWTASRLLFNFA